MITFVIIQFDISVLFKKYRLRSYSYLAMLACYNRNDNIVGVTLYTAGYCGLVTFSRPIAGPMIARLPLVLPIYYQTLAGSHLVTEETN